MTSVGLAAAGPPSSSSHSLLLHVKQALAHSDAAYASRGKVRLHVVFSTPRLASDLYPFAHIDGLDAANTTKDKPVEAYVEHIIMTASYGEEMDEKEEGGSKQGRLMYALECFLYTLPKHKSSLLYVSKLDSSGWGPTIPPNHLKSTLIQPKRDTFWDSSTSITRVITQAFLSYFASLSHWSNGDLDPVCHVSIHILARAQGAYLFPSSNDNKGKHILSDGGLIKWWRSVVSSVVCGVRRRPDDGAKIEAIPFYLVPGYDRLESHELLPLPPAMSTIAEPDSVLPVGDQALAEAGWVYGHPYSGKGADCSSSLPPLPLFGPSFKEGDRNHIATMLPHFPDDPKSRFIAEIARDSYEHAAGSKRKTDADGEVESGRQAVKKARTEGTAETKLEGQEKDSTPAISSLISKAKRERRALDAVSPDEFWTRMGFRQECCAGNAVGVFVALFTRLADEEADKRESGAMGSQKLALPHPIIPDLIRKHLMRDACDWSKAQGSRDLTKAWDEGVERAVRRKGGAGVGVEGGEVGRDVVYADVMLRGPTEGEIAAAEEKWRQGKGDGAAPVPASAAAAPVNMLSVKRKKKV